MSEEQNLLNREGFDPKNRKVTLTVSEEQVLVEKEHCESMTMEFDTYEAAEEYFEFLTTCSQNQ
jgi:hypothetical protein